MGFAVIDIRLTDDGGFKVVVAYVIGFLVSSLVGAAGSSRHDVLSQCLRMAMNMRCRFQLYIDKALYNAVIYKTHKGTGKLERANG